MEIPSQSKAKRLKVHHYCKTFFPIRGGIEVVVDKVCRIFVESTESTIISTSGDSCKERQRKERDYGHANVKLVKSLGTIFSMPVAPKVIYEVMKSFRVSDVVVVHYPYPLVDAACILFGWFSRARLVVYWHSNIHSQKVGKWFVLPFTYFMLCRANQVIVASPQMIMYSKLLRRFEHKLIVVPYSLSVENALESIDGDESRLIGKQVSDYFIAIGRHVEYKGFQVLINAVAQTSNEVVVIVGDGPLFEANESLVRELGVSDRVILVRSATDGEKAMLLKNSSGLILPSVYPSEAFALVQIEAMYCAKPIVNTKLKSGVPWVARDGMEAISVEPSSVEQLAVAIEKLANSRELRQTLGENGRNRYEALFSEKSFYKNLKVVFDGL